MSEIETMKKIQHCKAFSLPELLVVLVIIGILSASEGSVISLKSYNAVAIAVRNHLFPFRTEKLSSPAMMVLTYQLGE